MSRAPTLLRSWSMPDIQFIPYLSRALNFPADPDSINGIYFQRFADWQELPVRLEWIVDPFCCPADTSGTTIPYCQYGDQPAISPFIA